MADQLNAFCLDSDAYLQGAVEGPLTGLTYAAKDIFDVSGHVSGYGNPDWKATHSPAKETAWVLSVLTDAGATMLGKTITDELTRGILGENIHYGTPINSRAPGRVPGGSSSGSAAAVAGGLVDFAIGSDTGGSIRIPASFCGLFGIRPTHGRISVHGMLAQAPSYDTVGWLANDMDILGIVGSILLENEIDGDSVSRVIISDDTFALSDPRVAEVLSSLAERIGGIVGSTSTATLAPISLAHWSRHHRILQSREAWVTMRDWIERFNPRLSPEVSKIYAYGQGISDSEVEEARSVRSAILERVDALLAVDSVICMPTAPGPAPLRGHSESYGDRISMLTCVASATGVPQLTMPLGQIDGMPIGLSLLGPRGSDEALIGFGRKLAYLGG